MSTENENWYEDSIDGNKDTSRDGNRSYNRDGYNRRDDNRSSFNRDNNYNREGYTNRSYGDRPQRPAYNKYGNDRPNYNRNDRPQRPYNRDENQSYNKEGGERPYRPRFNSEEGGSRPRFNRTDGEQRPRFNRTEGEQRPGFNRTDGEQRPRFNRPEGYNRNDRPQQRPYNREDKPWRSNEERKPWQNNNEGGNRSTGGYRSNSGGYGNSSSYNRDNRDNDDRPRRPRFTSGDNKPQGFARPVRRTDDYNPNAKYSKKKQIEYREQFIDPNEPIRLNKFLANAGVCSRREADEFITAGVVSVNGEAVTELGTKIKRSDVVKFHDEPVSVERKVYVLLNKPKDCVTTSDDPQSRLTVMSLVKGACNERIYPVGRLDRNTTGVLLLTNDGDLASKLTHPKFLKKKIYHVHTDKNVTKHDMDQIATGIKLDDETEIKADAISYADDFKHNQVGIEIHSGQNRVVRRIFESLGYKVIKLDRVYFAGLTKKGLKRGDWRYLTENEVNYLRMGSFT